MMLTNTNDAQEEVTCKLRVEGELELSRWAGREKCFRQRNSIAKAKRQEQTW